MKKYLIIALGLLLLIFTFWFYKIKSTPHVVHPKISNIVESVYGLGIIKSHQTYIARVALTTLMEKIFVKEGQFVKRNTPLFRLAERSVVYAPFDGTVTHIEINDSEMIFPQKDILVMQNLDDLYVEVSLEQQGAVKIKKDISATLSFDVLSNAVIKGKVSAVLPFADKFQIKVQPEKLPENLLPGMSVDVTFDISSKANAVLIPLKAVANGYINLFVNGKSVRTKIESGLQDGEFIEILSPQLTPIDEIVISP